MRTFLCVLLLISIPARAADPLSVLLPPGILEDLAKVKASAERGDASAQHQLGNAYYRHFYFGKAAEWYQKAADQGHREALFSLAQILRTGKPAMKKDGSPVPKNEEQASLPLTKTDPGLLTRIDPLAGREGGDFLSK